MKKKGKVLPSNNNSANRTDYPRETEPGEKKERFCLQITTAQIGLTTQERQSQKEEEKKGKVLPSDNNSPNKTDYPGETEPGEKKERFCLQITTAQIGLTTQERQSQEKKKERFCLQITTAQIGLTTQERQSQVKKRRGSAFR